MAEDGQHIAGFCCCIARPVLGALKHNFAQEVTTQATTVPLLVALAEKLLCRVRYPCPSWGSSLPAGKAGKPPAAKPPGKLTVRFPGAPRKQVSPCEFAALQCGRTNLHMQCMQVAGGRNNAVAGAQLQPKKRSAAAAPKQPAISLPKKRGCEELNEQYQRPPLRELPVQDLNANMAVDELPYTYKVRWHPGSFAGCGSALYLVASSATCR
jgi:hypothetical protein